MSSCNLTHEEILKRALQKMWSFKKMLVTIYILAFIAFDGFQHCQGFLRHYEFYVKEASYERLCEKKNILTVNGQFPGPTIYAHKGDTIHVRVHNEGTENITIHWHGVKLPRYPWSDGTAYITQCPIQPGKTFRQKIIFSTEEGTLWWHAHSNWARATVHGAVIVYPMHGIPYPFSTPDQEIPIVIADWWKEDVNTVLNDLITNGGDPTPSDAFTVNGQPGDLYPCSKKAIFKAHVDQGKTYLLRFVNAAMNNIFFISIRNHPLTVVGIDGSYTKQLTRSYIVLSPGQTMDCLLIANQTPQNYYMAIRAYHSAENVNFNNSTGTAVIRYNRASLESFSIPSLPSLPYYNDTKSAFDFFGSVRNLASREHPPLFSVKTKKDMLISTVSVNTFPCANNSCDGPNGSRLAGSMNSISFVSPVIDILQAYYYQIKGVFGEHFPNVPPYFYNFTGEDSSSLYIPSKRTEVKVLKYNTMVELVFQGTSLLGGIEHPMHVHGLNFYVVGYGFGNFDKDNDPKNYNVDDPPLLNTVTVPKNGWAAIRFKANNPGVWFVHCHFERHATWGMEMALIVKDGEGPNEVMLPPPKNMPPC